MFEPSTHHTNVPEAPNLASVVSWPLLSGTAAAPPGFADTVVVISADTLTARTIARTARFMRPPSSPRPYSAHVSGSPPGGTTPTASRISGEVSAGRQPVRHRGLAGK